MGYDFELRDQSSVIHPTHGDALYSLSIDGSRFRVVLIPTGVDGEFVLDFNGERESVFVASDGDAHFVHFRGRAYRVDAINALDRAKREAAPSDGAEQLCAPMPGVVVDVLVKQGDQVGEGQLLMTIESMKLQTPIVAPHDAVVSEVRVGVGSNFEHGAVLVRLETPNNEEGEAK
jgi:biotin carboxyl carrier protein